MKNTGYGSKNRSREKGQAFSEFALSFPFFILVLFGSLQMMGAFYQSNAMQDSVSFGALAGMKASDPLYMHDIVKEQVVRRMGKYGFMINQEDVKVRIENGKNMVSVELPLTFLGMGLRLGPDVVTAKKGWISEHTGPLPANPAAVES